MPVKYYRHYCSSKGEEVICGAEVCSSCGVRGEFKSWSWSVVEHFCRSTRRRGLPLFDPLPRPPGVESFSRTCTDCAGSGIFDVNDGESFRICSECDGDGGHPVFEEPALEFLRRRLRDVRLCTGTVGGLHTFARKRPSHSTGLTT